MSNLTILRSYAQKANPASLPPSILLTHSATSLTIFDAYPKSIFHFLILPRIVPPLTVFDLASLRTLLKCSKDRAKDVVLGLSNDAKRAKELIEEEMITRYGFKWDVWMGFHGAPSMECVDICYSCITHHSYSERHLHLHVLSADLFAPGMKHKKHYNSFHPKLGFFIHMEEILSWFDAEQSYFSTVRVRLIIKPRKPNDKASFVDHRTRRCLNLGRPDMSHCLRKTFHAGVVVER